MGSSMINSRAVIYHRPGNQFVAFQLLQQTLDFQQQGPDAKSNPWSPRRTLALPPSSVCNKIIQDVVDQPSIVSQVADVVPKLYAAGRQLHPSTCGDVMQSLLGANQARCCTHCIGCKHPPPYAAQPAAALDLALKVLDVPLPPPPPTSVAASALQAMAGSAHITPATSVAAAAALEALAGTVVPLTATSEGYSAQSLASALLTVAVNHAVHSGDPAVMTQLLDSMQRRDAAPPYSALAALVLVLRIMQQHTAQNALLQWLQATRAHHLLPLLLMEAGNLRLAARPASRLPTPPATPPPAAPPLPMQQRVQQDVLDRLLLLRHLSQWPVPGVDVVPQARRLWLAALAVQDPPNPLVMAEYASVMLDAGEVDAVLELLKPESDDQVGRMLYAVASRPPCVQVALTTALYGSTLQRPPIWNEIGMLLYGNNARVSVDALTHSSAHASMKLARRATHRPLATAKRHSRRQPTRMSASKGPPPPHTPPRLLCTHLLQCPPDHSDPAMLQRCGLDGSLPTDVDVAALATTCSASRTALLPLRMQVQLALQETTPPSPGAVVKVTVLIGALATRLEGYSACKLLAVLDASGAEVPRAAVSWALLGAVNAGPHALPALQLLLMSTDRFQPATQRLLKEVIQGDTAFVHEASDVITRAIRRHVAIAREREKRALELMAADAEIAMFEGHPANFELPNVWPMGDQDWDQFLYECRQLTESLQTLLTPAHQS